MRSTSYTPYGAAVSSLASRTTTRATPSCGRRVRWWRPASWALSASSRRSTCRTGCRPSWRKPGTNRPAGWPCLGAAAAHATRIPAGHPEGYLEGFANLYHDLAEQIRARRAKRAPDPRALLVPTVEDGARGVKFIAAAVESNAHNGAWVDARVRV